MKKTGLVLALFLWTCSSTFSQQAKKVNPSKYRINLPNYWKPGSKAVQVLADRLPEVCEELKDKELCGDDCRAKYTLEFYMSEPKVFEYRANLVSVGTEKSTYNFVTSYSFESALLLFDESDKLLKRINLVNADEVFTITHRAELNNYVPSMNNRQSMNTQAPGTVAIPNLYPANYWNTRTIRGQTPYSYIEEHVDKLYPTRNGMLSVVDDHIRDLKPAEEKNADKK